MVIETNDLKLILAAADFAASRHAGQTRKDEKKTPYINHPLAVAKLLAVEGGISDVKVICAALLHDTVEDTDTSWDELSNNFGAIAKVVHELTDDKSLPKEERKQNQILYARHSSHEARLIKLADKICNLRDIQTSPPVGWDEKRKQEYFEWAAAVVSGIRGTHAHLESIFDELILIGPNLPDNISTSERLIDGVRPTLGEGGDGEDDTEEDAYARWFSPSMQETYRELFGDDLDEMNKSREEEHQAYLRDKADK